MKNFIILLFTLLCVSCSKLVDVDYTLLDQGQVTEITETSSEFIKVKIISANDSVCRQWRHSGYRDDLSLRVMTYTEKIQVGDFVYVYDNDG